MWAILSLTQRVINDARCLSLVLLHCPFRLSQDANVPSVQHYQLSSYAFDDISLSDRETCLATIRVFLDLQFVQKFHIDYQVNSLERILAPLLIRLFVLYHDCWFLFSGDMCYYLVYLVTSLDTNHSTPSITVCKTEACFGQAEARHSLCSYLRSSEN